MGCDAGHSARNPSALEMLRSARTLLALCLVSLVLAAPSKAAARESLFLGVDGVERHYLLTIPDGASEKAPAPLVIVLHGAGMTAGAMAAMTGFDGLAEEEGFFAAFPDGTGPIRLYSWNAYHCCSTAMTDGIDDIAFVSALIDTLVAAYPVDPSRIYVAGFSNGGMMAHRVGIALSDKVAAIGSVAGALFGDEPAPGNPVPAIIVNGADDPVIPADGRIPTADGPLWEIWDGTPLKTADYQGAFWARANDCYPNPIAVRAASYRLERYMCPPGGAVEYYLVADNRHAWPGNGILIGSVSNEEFDATGILWDFFRRQSRLQPGESVEPDLEQSEIGQIELRR